MRAVPVPRLFSVFTLVLSLLLVIPAATMAQPAKNGGPGNSGAAKQCQKGGWQTLAREESPMVAFASHGECVSAGAQGHTIVDLVLVEPDARCMDDGFYAWRTVDAGRFTSSDECNAYVAGGGELAEPVPHIIIADLGFSDGQCTVQALFRDLPIERAWYGRFSTTGGPEYGFIGGAYAPYGDSRLGSQTLSVGQTYTVKINEAPFEVPVPTVAFTCQAPA